MMDEDSMETKDSDHDIILPKDQINREQEYFQTVLRPMLNPGHEGELCEWLKLMGLLRRSPRCSNTSCPKLGTMRWTKARIVDKYSWACVDCSRKQTIREGSFFFSIKCELKVIIQAILAWCEQTPVEVTSKNLGLKGHIVKKVYERCCEVTQLYVINHPHDWILGGDGAVVIVDVFPDGYMSPPPVLGKKTHAKEKKILCIADTSHMPARVWATILQQNLQDQGGNSRPGVVEEALTHVRQHVRSGSTLVVNERARYCSHEAVQELVGFPTVISVETLMLLDPPGTRCILDNLETIWQSAVEVCENVQDMQKQQGSILLHEYMWRQMFATSSSSALESILHHIADQFQTQD